MGFVRAPSQTADAVKGFPCDDICHRVSALKISLLEASIFPVRPQPHDRVSPLCSPGSLSRDYV